MTTLSKEITMQDAVDAGNGTLHSAIDYWQERALKAEDEVSRQKVAILSLCANVQTLVAEQVTMQQRLREANL